MADIPPWLNIMRSITGTKEVEGSGSNPAITGMADEIARRYPDMEDYCDLSSWDDDATPWCGEAAAYCMAVSDIRPPFKDGSDTDCWGWAQSWASDPGFVRLSAPVPGAVVVLTRSGGGHVTFYESTSGSNYNCRGGNQSNAVTLAPFPKSSVIGLFWPRDYALPDIPEIPPEDRPVLEEGDTGPDVAAVQTTLGIPADGDFGPVTSSAVRGLQAACGLEVDAVVGADTWTALDELAGRKAAGSEALDDPQIDAIVSIAASSAIARYQWRDRGTAPPGWMAGLACCFAACVLDYQAGVVPAIVMAQCDRGDANTDALAFYRGKFQALGMSNAKDGLDTLRHLFVMILGLGMRESSGRYCEGRDMSASNTSPDEAEAGCLQTSWNIRSAHPTIPPLLRMFWDAPLGLLDVFRMGVEVQSRELDNYGNGQEGTRYQFLSKHAPQMHVEVTALGMRYLRKHWGPINRSEVELRADADTMLRAVQDYILAEPAPPEPEPPAELSTITITIDPPGSARVVVVGGAA